MDYDHKNVEYLSPDQLSVAVASCYRNTDIDELLEVRFPRFKTSFFIQYFIIVIFQIQ